MQQPGRAGAGAAGEVAGLDQPDPQPAAADLAVCGRIRQRRARDPAADDQQVQRGGGERGEMLITTGRDGSGGHRHWCHCPGARRSPPRKSAANRPRRCQTSDAAVQTPTESGNSARGYSAGTSRPSRGDQTYPRSGRSRVLGVDLVGAIARRGRGLGRHRRGRPRTGLVATGAARARRGLATVAGAGDGTAGGIAGAPGWARAGASAAGGAPAGRHRTRRGRGSPRRSAGRAAPRQQVRPPRWRRHRRNRHRRRLDGLGDRLGPGPHDLAGSGSGGSARRRDWGARDGGRRRRHCRTAPRPRAGQDSGRGDRRRGRRSRSRPVNLGRRPGWSASPG